MSASLASALYRRLTQLELDQICARHDRLWQARPGGARAVLAYLDLSGLDFRGRNLTDADFTGCLLADADLTGARLDHSNFFGADMQGAILVDASLRRADLRGVCLRGANLCGADLFEADLREGTIAAADKRHGLRFLEHEARITEARGAILAGANLQRSKLSGVVAIRADFSDAVMKDVKLVRANLKQATMTGADLSGADLSGADLEGADLRDTVLVGAKTLQWNVSSANLAGALTDRPVGADVSSLPYEAMLKAHALWCETSGHEGTPSSFEKADLRALKSIRGFNLTALIARGAVLYGLDMEGVQLQGAQLQGADLRNCNLRRADLRGAQLNQAKLSGADLRDAQLGPLLIGQDRVLPANFTGASAKFVDFSGADLRRCLFTGADLERSTFTGALTRQMDVQDARLVGVKGLALPL